MNTAIQPNFQGNMGCRTCVNSKKKKTLILMEKLKEKNKTNTAI